MKKRTAKKSVKRCSVCGRRVFSPNSNHCWRCAQFIRRMDQRGVHPEAAKRILAHVRKHGYVCFYTKEPLNLTDPQSPFYYVFDHQVPGDDTTVVLTFALLNEMKCDMDWKEFKYYLRQITNNIFKGTKIRRKKLIYWFRLLALNSKRKASLPRPLTPIH